MTTIINAAVMYWVLLFALRLVGRRGPNMMTPFEMIVIFLLGGLAIQAVVGEDHSMTNALLGIMTVVLMHVLVSTLKGRSPAFGKVVDGTPIIVYGSGEWHEKRMKRLRLQEQDVMAAARQQGLERLEQVKYAVVERNGAISVVRQDGEG